MGARRNNLQRLSIPFKIKVGEIIIIIILVVIVVVRLIHTRK